MGRKKKQRFGFFQILLLGTFFIIGFTIYSSPLLNKMWSAGNTNSDSKDKEFEKNYTQAINLIKNVNEVNYIENKVMEQGRTPFYTPDGIENGYMLVSLRESFPDDPHTTKIDTFKVKLDTKEIKVVDAVTMEDIPLNRWRITVAQRFP